MQREVHTVQLIVFLLFSNWTVAIIFETKLESLLQYTKKVSLITNCNLKLLTQLCLSNLLIYFKSIAITSFQCSRQLANLLRKQAIAMRIRYELNNHIQKYEFNNHIYSIASVLLFKKIQHWCYSENGNRVMIKKFNRRLFVNSSFKTCFKCQ